MVFRTFLFFPCLFWLYLLKCNFLISLLIQTVGFYLTKALVHNTLEMKTGPFPPANLRSTYLGVPASNLCPLKCLDWWLRVGSLGWPDQVWEQGPWCPFNKITEIYRYCPGCCRHSRGHVRPNTILWHSCFTGGGRLWTHNTNRVYSAHTHSASWLAGDHTGLLTPLPLKSQKPWVMFLTLPLADPVSLGLGFLGGWPEITCVKCLAHNLVPSKSLINGSYYELRFQGAQIVSWLLRSGDAWSFQNSAMVCFQCSIILRVFDHWGFLSYGPCFLCPLPLLFPTPGPGK